MDEPYSHKISETVRGRRIPYILSSLLREHSRYSAIRVVIWAILDKSSAFQCIPLYLVLLLHFSEKRQKRTKKQKRQEETEKQERLVKGCFDSNRD